MADEVQRHFLTLESGLSSAGEASIWARTLAAACDVPEDRVANLDLCIIELINNVVDYGYGGGPGEIGLELTTASDSLVLSIIDSGPAFNPLDMPAPTLPKSLDDARIGGFGVHLVREFADFCHYERVRDRNIFTVGFGKSMVLPRREERRQAQEEFVPGDRIEHDRRSGMDRRALGFISRCSLFRNVPYADLEAILARCQLIDYPVDTLVLNPDALSRKVLVVVEGSLRVHLGGRESDDAVEIPCGECVGELSVADGKPSSAWVVTAEPSRLLVIDGPVFLEQLLAVPRIGRNLIILLAERMRHSNERMVERVRGALELEALQRELDFARQIQSSMLPANPLFPHSTAVDCHGFMRAARQVGGDFYDVLQQGPNRFFLAIGDVCNKGMPAALFMAQALTLLRSEAARLADELGLQLAALARHGNDQLANTNEAQLFVSLFCAILDLDSGRLHYVNAGHNPPLLVLPGEAPVFLDQPRNPIAGMVPGLEFTAGCIEFPAGSQLLMYTDGVTEAEAADASQFGEAPLLGLLTETFADAATGVQRIVDAVDSFADGHPQSDDITLLLVRRC